MSKTPSLKLIKRIKRRSDIIKLSVYVHRVTIAKLRAIATLEGTTVTEVVNFAFGLLIHLDNERRQGNQILVRTGPEVYKELILTVKNQD